jgi:hypothetical protein
MPAMVVRARAELDVSWGERMDATGCSSPPSSSRSHSPWRTGLDSPWELLDLHSK